MKKLAYTFLVLMTAGTIFTSCRDQKTAGEKIEDGVEEVGDGVEDAAEDVADEVEDAVD
ncbi:hypothetical protein [Mariniflexile sp.]|uniref:hypothetical protein n=1 Tax=Mariniflexile sp. TaxID=1979402 RepID=UPI003568C2A4